MPASQLLSLTTALQIIGETSLCEQICQFSQGAPVSTCTSGKERAALLFLKQVTFYPANVCSCAVCSHPCILLFGCVHEELIWCVKQTLWNNGPYSLTVLFFILALVWKIFFFKLRNSLYGIPHRRNFNCPVYKHHTCSHATALHFTTYWSTS